MDKFQKDKEILRLRALLKARNATIRLLKTQAKPTKAVRARILPEMQNEEAQELSEEEEHAMGISRTATEIFGKIPKCGSCGQLKIDAIAFCTACNIGWTYCNKCGGFERAQQENKDHITPTHGVFLDMFDKNEVRNSFGKPN